MGEELIGFDYLSDLDMSKVILMATTDRAMNEDDLAKCVNWAREADIFYKHLQAILSGRMVLGVGEGGDIYFRALEEHEVSEARTALAACEIAFIGKDGE